METSYACAFTENASKSALFAVPEPISFSIPPSDPPRRGDVLIVGEPPRTQPFVVIERQYRFAGNGDCTITLVLDIPA
ncbi:DNA-binding protein [Cupriavidus basilensis]|uniref:DNA-binding protein n=1 Tax=Cupriavidus basilensis TaxID=68895 RepID=UPI0020A6C6E7|nr:DNA-binding protein [Cupriavidus basilensis]MCP3017515.1 DNA-binding protein [Cupriavidus basilensis]